MRKIMKVIYEKAFISFNWFKELVRTIFEALRRVFIILVFFEGYKEMQTQILGHQNIVAALASIQIISSWFKMIRDEFLEEITAEIASAVTRWFELATNDWGATEAQYGVQVNFRVIILPCVQLRFLMDELKVLLTYDHNNKKFQILWWKIVLNID